MKILLVDDEADIRKIAQLSLEAVGGFRTVCAEGAVRALEIAASERPDVILMDVMMPGMDGITALAELKRDPSLGVIPVIFMTAKVQRAEIDRYLALGAIGVIQKPFDPMTLPEQIRALLPGG